MPVAAFVIAMRSAVERAEQVERLIAACPVPCRRWDATDGRAMSPEQTARFYVPGLHRPRYGFGLTPAEVGCFLSHRRVWQHMVDASLSHALIMEDDLELLPNFDHVFRFALEQSPPASLVKFDVREFEGPCRTVSRDEETAIVRPQLIPLRATAQLVSHAAAKRLLEHTRQFDRPVDTFLQMRWLHDVDVLVARPRCTAEVSDMIGGSIINRSQDRRPLLQVMYREVKRKAYRRHIDTRSRRDFAA